MGRERKTTVFIYLPGDVRATPAGIFTHDADSGIPEIHQIHAGDRDIFLIRRFDRYPHPE